MVIYQTCTIGRAYTAVPHLRLGNNGLQAFCRYLRNRLLLLRNRAAEPPSL